MKDNKVNQTIDEKNKSKDTEYIKELVKTEEQYSLKASKDEKLKKKLNELTSY